MMNKKKSLEEEMAMELNWLIYILNDFILRQQMQVDKKFYQYVGKIICL